MRFPFVRLARALLEAAFGRGRELEPPVAPAGLHDAPPAPPTLTDPADFVSWLDAGQPETIAWWLEQPPASREVLARLGSEWRRAEFLILADTLANPDAAYLALYGEPRESSPAPRAQEAASEAAQAAAIAEALAARLLARSGPTPAPHASAGRPAFAGHGERQRARAAAAGQALRERYSFAGIPATPAADSAAPAASSSPAPEAAP